MNPSKLKDQILQYSSRNGYSAKHFAIARCAPCGGTVFTLLMNEEQGVAARICVSCQTEHGIGDSDDYIDEVDTVYPVECTCGNRRFEVMGAVALYTDSQDVSWLYLGCECVSCETSGVYGDWKNEFIDYRKFLERI